MAKKRWLPQWCHRLGSPRGCYEITGKWLPSLASLAALSFIVGVIWALVFAPPDYQQGNSFRIIYLHVPAAILAQSCYMLMAISGAMYLISKMKVADIVSQACLPVGASMTLLALLTGSLWGKPTWGTWWVWDARLTSMLILLFLYLGVMAIRSAIEYESAAAKASAFIALVGLVNIPVIKYSVDWWNTLHQPATFTLTEKPNMPVEMWLPLLVMLVAFYSLFAVLIILRIRNEILHRERRSLWVRQLITSSSSAAQSE